MPFFLKQILTITAVSPYRYDFIIRKAYQLNLRVAVDANILSYRVPDAITKQK